VASSDRVRQLSKILAGPCIELRKLLRMSRTSLQYDNRFREKSVKGYPEVLR